MAKRVKGRLVRDGKYEFQVDKEGNTLGMWVYQARDEYGLPMAAAYCKSDLIEKLIEEFGTADFKIVREFDETLR